VLVSRSLNLLSIAVRGGMKDGRRNAIVSVLAALAAMGILAALSVDRIGAGDGPYRSELLQNPDLRRGLVAGLLALVVPLVALIGQCARLSAPRRDRRLATLRLLGAAPRDVTAVACMETVVPVVVGAAAGVSSYGVGQRLLDGPLTVHGRYVTQVVHHHGPLSTTVIPRSHIGDVKLFATDAHVPVVLAVAACVLLAVVSALVSWLAVRSVNVTAFRVVRRTARSQPPRVLPWLLFVFGLGGLLAYTTVRTFLRQPGHLITGDVFVVLGLFTMSGVGIVVGCAGIAARLGGWLAARARSAPVLIASRRLAADPFASSRSNAVIVLAVLVVAAGQALKADFLVITDPLDPFYASTFHVVDLGYAVAVVLASLGAALRTIEVVGTSRDERRLISASGVPDAVVRRSLVLETLIPLVPCSVAAAVAGYLGMRGVLGGAHERDRGGGAAGHLVLVVVPVPWAALTLLVAFACAIPALLAWLVVSASGSGGKAPLRITA
jgi:hypothetical protein